MRQLEHQISRTRAAIRRAWARLGRVDPKLGAPARLVIRLDEADLPGTMGEGEALTTQDFNRIIVQAVEWLGPLPVTFRAQHSAEDPQLVDLIRFAHRLECPTQLVTDGTGLDIHKARQLVDVGLARVRVLVGGVSDEVHRAVVGNPGPDAAFAVQALLEARAERGASLDIEVGIPWVGPAPTECRAVMGWARQLGVDGVRILAPFIAENMPADPELLDSLADDAGTFCRNDQATLEEIHAMVAHQDGRPGAPRTHGPPRRTRWKCPVGGQRMAVTRNGDLYSCPHHAPVGQIEGELRETWDAAGKHLSAIAGCDRICAHTELAPERIWG